MFTRSEPLQYSCRSEPREEIKEIDNSPLKYNRDKGALKYHITFSVWFNDLPLTQTILKIGLEFLLWPNFVCLFLVEF